MIAGLTQQGGPGAMTDRLRPGYPSRVTAHRRATAIGLVLALVALAGCSVQGRVEVRSAVAVDVDVTVRADRSPYCNADIVGLSTIPERGRGGVITSCRYLGTLDPSQLGWALGLAGAGEYLVAVFNPLQVPASGPSDATENQLDAVDVVVVMPGSIQEANSGLVSDDQVRITDPDVLTLPGGLRLVALNHPGPAHWVWWLVGGVLAGVCAATVVLLLIQRLSRRRAAVGPLPGADGEVEPEADLSDPAERADPADGADLRADPAETPARSAAPVDDPSAWARPSEEPPPRTGPTDASIWAPEDPQGNR